MSGNRVALGIGAFCLVSGWGAGVWILSAALLAKTRFFPEDQPAPAIVRTDPATISPLPKDLDALLHASRGLSKGQVAGMRARLEKVPGDTRTRALLLDHAWFDFQAHGMNDLHNEQLVWFVANQPRSPILVQPQAEILPRGNAPTKSLVRRLFDEALTKTHRDPTIRLNADHILGRS